MAYKHSKIENRHRARRLRDTLLPQVPTRLKEVASVEVGSALAGNVFGHVTLDNVAGVHVFPENGGWTADIALCDLPVGVPTMIGTSRPAPTREAAVHAAVGLLATIEHAASTRKAAGTKRPTHSVIEIDGLVTEIQTSMLEAVRSRAVADELPTEEFARRRLDTLCEALTDGDHPLTKADLDAASDHERMVFTAVCAQALILGINRHTSPAARRAESTGWKM